MNATRKIKLLQSKSFARVVSTIGTILVILLLSIALTNYFSTTDWSIKFYTDVRDILGFGSIKKWQIMREMQSIVPLILLSLVGAFKINITIN